MKHHSLIFLALLMLISCFTFASQAKDYGRRLTLKERNQICDELKATREQNATSEPRTTSLGGGVIPDSVIANIYNTTRDISDATAFILVLGHALTCNAVNANSFKVTIAGIQLMSVPNIPVWSCGAIIYFFGFMLTLSVTFYLVDIAFKLGFAVIMLPIGVALWPFPITKDKLSILISIMLKNAAIFVFLALAVSYGLNLIGEAGGGLEDIFDRIDRNETDTISEDFSLASTNFLIIMFALVYSMKLIGSAVADYADKFFPDKAFGGGQSASPIHGSMTQAMDFAKKKAVDPVVSWAGDVAKTQAGRATAGVGKLLTGEYNSQIKKGAYFATHPGAAIRQGGSAAARAAGNFGGGAARAANNVIVGGIGGAILGKKASQEIRDNIEEKINTKQESLNEWADKQTTQTNQKIEKSRVTKAAGKVSGVFNKVDQAYQKTINKFDQASNFLNRATKPISDKVNKICDNIDKKTDKSSFLGRAKAFAMKTGVRTAGLITKLPVKAVTTVANIPIKTAKFAVKAAYVKNWLTTTGTIMQSVGDKMQRNQKTPQDLQREAQRKARAEYEEELERERQRRQSSPGEDNYD